MAHRLIAQVSEKCAIPHGHNEIVTVRLVAVTDRRLDGDVNMVEPFERAKSTWHRWIDAHVDHTFQLADHDPLIGWFREFEPHRLARLMVMPGDPTTETLACCMMSKLNQFLAADGGRLRCAEIRIEETPTNTVIFEGDPIAALPSLPGLHWWQRADMSINDLVPVGSAREVVSA